jgi:hypothetical protein
MPAHEVFQKYSRAMVQRLMIGVSGHTVTVECNENVNVGLWLLFGVEFRHFWGVLFGEKAGDEFGFPVCRHGVGQVAG